MWLNLLERHIFLRGGEGSEVAWEMHGALQVSVSRNTLFVVIIFAVFQSNFTSNKANIGILSLILVSIFIFILIFIYSEFIF